MNVAQELINKWGVAKYGNQYAGKRFDLEVEKESEGYCDTCWYEYACIKVLVDNKEIAELTEKNIVELLQEILSAQ